MSISITADLVATAHREGQVELLKAICEASNDGVTWYFTVDGFGVCANDFNPDTNGYDDTEFTDPEQLLDFLTEKGYLKP